MATAFEENFARVLEAETSYLLRTPNVNTPLSRDKPFEDPIGDKFVFSNSSYSGTDCTVMVQLRDKLIALGNLETFSYSIFREKEPVRVLGRSYVKGYTAGPRTISGTMVFVLFDRHPLFAVIKELNYVRNPEDRYTSPLMDQLPPLDFILLFHNEYGHMSILRIYGVEFLQEGQTHSINDLYSENINQYFARDIDILTAMDQVEGFRDMLFNRQLTGQFVDNNLQTMLEYKRQVEGKIATINKYVTAIDTENSRRNVAGVVTLGVSEALSWGVSKLPGTNLASRLDLQKQKDSYLKIKQELLVELENINLQIRNYERNITGWNAQSNQQGSAGIDNIRTSAPLTKLGS